LAEAPTIDARPARVARRTLSAVPRGADTDDVLRARMIAGDERALAVVYDRHAPMVFGLARRVTGNDQLADDVVQEVFSHLWRMPERIDLARGSIRSYLGVLAHRRAVDEVRRSVRQSRLESRAGDGVEAVASHEDDLVDAGAARWRTERLCKLLADLPSDQREAVELAYFGGRTYRQVADELGIPEGTAKSRLRMGLARLREALASEDMRAWL
jgi:RNA polymerase sigma-70 factor (ECF subfamily)